MHSFSLLAGGFRAGLRHLKGGGRVRSGGWSDRTCGHENFQLFPKKMQGDARPLLYEHFSSV